MWGGESASSADEEAGGIEGDGKRRSVKRAFVRLALGPVREYPSLWELAHSAWDLSYFTGLASKKTATAGELEIKRAANLHPMFPEKWKVRLRCLIDMVRQLGPPHVFITLTVYEWSLAYHVSALSQMQDLLRRRTNLSGPESWRAAHVLTHVFQVSLALL